MWYHMMLFHYVCVLTFSDSKWLLMCLIFSLPSFIWWVQVSSCYTVTWSYWWVCHGCHGSRVTVGSIQRNISLPGSMSDPSINCLYYGKAMKSCDPLAPPPHCYRNHLLCMIWSTNWWRLYILVSHTLFCILQIANRICCSSSSRDPGRPQRTI